MFKAIIEALKEERFSATEWHKGGYSRLYVKNNSGRDIGYIQAELDFDDEVEGYTYHLSANRRHIEEIVGRVG